MFSEKLFKRLYHATHITFLTGAGISAESGVPTFRGKDGLWNNHDVMQLATPLALKTNTDVFWEFYNWRRRLVTDIEPNLGHYALVDFERLISQVTVITQNVDGLHQKAGSTDVLELHGNIMRSRCSECGYLPEADGKILAFDKIPYCPKCNGLIRPDVVLFNENLNSTILYQAQEASATCEVFFSIGTSSLVEPAASLPYIAKANGAYLVEINVERTPLSDNADEFIEGKSGKILPMITVLFEKIREK